MSHTVEIINSEISVRVETETQVDAEERYMSDLFLKLKEWGTRASLAEIVLTQDGGDPCAYSYEVRKKDDREMLVSYNFADAQDNNPLMAVTLSPAWLASDIAFGAVVREALIAIHMQFGLISMEVGYS